MLKYLYLSLLIGCSASIPTKDQCEYLYDYSKEDFCDKTITYDVVIDNSFSNDELEYIKAGLSAWTIVSDNHIKFNLIGFEDHDYLLKQDQNILSIVRTTNKDVLSLNFINEKPSGVYFKNKVYLLVDRMFSLENFRAILVHEIGHYLGLEHYNSTYSIMNAVVAENSCIYEFGLPTKLDYNNLRKQFCNPIKSTMITVSVE